MKLLLALLLAGVAAPPPPSDRFYTVADVLAGRRKPAGRVRIHVLRAGVWRETETVEAASVEWLLLLPGDRVEQLEPELRRADG